MLSWFRLTLFRTRALSVLVVPIALQLPTAAARAAWLPNGSPVTTAPGEQLLRSLVPDGHGGVYVFWRDNRLGYDYAPRYDVYGQHLDSAGNVATGWDSLGNAIANSDLFEDPVRSVTDGAGGAIVMWQSGNDYRLQRMLSDGSKGWDAEGIAVADGGVHRSAGQLMADRAGGVYLVWADGIQQLQQALCPHCHPTYIYHLRAQHMDGLGNRLWGPAGIAVVPDSVGTGIRLLEGNDGAPLVLWVDVAGTVRAQEFNPGGSPRLDPAGQPIPNFRFGLMTSTGPRQEVSFWMAGGDTQEDLFAQHLAGDLTVDWGGGGEPVVTAPHKQEATGIASDGEKGALLAWHDLRNGLDWDVYAQRLTAGGTPAPGWPDGGLPICTAPGTQASPIITSDGEGGAYVSWTDARDSLTDYDVYLQRVLADGAIPSGWPEQGLAVCSLPQVQAGPQMVLDGKGGLIVAWNDYRRGSEIYAQKILLDGSIGDEVTAVMASLVDLRIAGGEVSVEWEIDAPGVYRVDVLRQLGEAPPIVLAQATLDGSHRVRFKDPEAPAGHVGYSVRYRDEDGERVSSVAWIDVPARAAVAFEGFRPNPSPRAVSVHFVLPSPSAARLEVFDVRGHRVRLLNAPGLAAGPNSLSLGSALSPGVYWVELTACGRSLVARGVVVE